MAILLLIAVLGAYWMKSKGKISERQGWGAGLGVIGALLAVRGRPLVGAALMAAGVAVGASRRRSRHAAKASLDDKAIERARALLGVGHQASDEEIRAAHRRLIAQNHPDRGGSAAAASQINAARDILLQRNADTPYG